MSFMGGKSETKHANDGRGKSFRRRATRGLHEREAASDRLSVSHCLCEDVFISYEKQAVQKYSGQCVNAQMYLLVIVRFIQRLSCENSSEAHVGMYVCMYVSMYVCIVCIRFQVCKYVSIYV